MRFDRYVTLLKINDRMTPTLVPLVLNNVQRRVRARIAAALREQRPCRLIVLKSRRMGVSTIIQASFAHLAFTSSRFHSATGAHEDKGSATLHAMTEQMYDNLPDAYRPKKNIGLRGKELAFSNGSGMMTFTAGGRGNALRSQGYRALHGSEVAFWPDTKATLQSARQTVPYAPGTFVILESTANGVGDEFHGEWQRAKEGLSDYEALFFAWYEFDDYRMPVPERGLGRVDEDEESLRALGVDDEQLQWRRHTIANECGGDLDSFHQEYPSTDIEAFLSSGRPYFRKMERFVPEPHTREGWFVGDPIPGERPGKLPITFIPEPNGLVKIWETPKPGVRYAIWSDVAGSGTLKQYNQRRKGEQTDAYAAYVIDLQTGYIVAAMHGRVGDEKLWAFELARVGRIYNNALIAVEKVGGYGVATILCLRDDMKYPNLWREVDFDSDEVNDEAGVYGWLTSVTTRPQMLTELDAVLREDPKRLRDVKLRDEMSTFVINQKGKPEAEEGYHDDRVMAAAGAMRIFSLRAQPLPRPKTTKRKQQSQSILERAPRIDRSRWN